MSSLMPSRGAKSQSPLESLLQQWFGSLRTSSGPASSYRILFQYSNSSLQLRTKAIAPIVTPKHQLEERARLYRRAGVRRPEESGIRDLAGSQAWLIRLIELVFQLGETDSDSPLHLIYIATGTSFSSAIEHLLDSEYKHRDVNILTAPDDPWGWEEEHDGGLNLADLDQLKNEIQQQIFVRKPQTSVVVIESLSPLLMRHGLEPTLRFVRAITADLVVMPVSLECVKPSHHTRLEDLSHALLSVEDGHMMLMRQGFRESGNVIRQISAFDVHQGANGRLQLKDEDDQFSLTATDPIHPDDSYVRDVKNSASATLEDNQQADGVVSVRLKEESSKDSQQRTSTSPTIFLEDDDPEFDDLDEEDPDDDLDI